MKILIADDDATTRLLLSRKVMKLGHDVQEALDGEEAWMAFRLHQPRIVVTDWMMPKLDGIRFCQAVRSENREKYTYLIMLTALGGKVNYIEAMNAGADDFMTKPVDLDMLEMRIRVAERVIRLQAEVSQLQGLLPICSYCKRIRTDGNEWQAVERYIGSRTEAAFSHGICPECYEKQIQPQLARYKQVQSK